MEELNFKVKIKLIKLLTGLLLFLFACGTAFATAVPPLTDGNRASASDHFLRGQVKSGDTATSLLSPYLPLAEIYRVDRQAKKVFPLTRIRQGKPYAIRLKENVFWEFEYEINDLERLIIRKKGQGYDIARLPIEYDIQPEVVRIRVGSTLAGELKFSTESFSLSMKLADIFSWNIDFSKDIQEGDHAQVLVEKLYRHGKFFGYGDVLAAFFTNRGREHQAFLLKNENGTTGYFDENGDSLETAFLKAPLDFTRVSSSFSGRRLHPILKIYRPHTSIDFAAPKNTPIKTVAHGTIHKIGYNKTMGRYIIICHADGYETQYMHMNHFARGMKKNKRVARGEVIGYVGKTGLATGYHLDFSIRKNGRALNPLSIKLPKGNPVPKTDMPKFKNRVAQWSRTIRSAGHLTAIRGQGTSRK